ncbi:MAG TPA: dTMP kinase [Syntrophobacteraceae bacterium]|nr:dTMP kinase [Syntrophobacteraceae bacterium]
MAVDLRLPARFISFEGIDGCGKSTLLEKLHVLMDQVGIPFVQTREPGGTEIGEQIREVLLDPRNKSMDTWTEVLLYSASRAQHAIEAIQPALQRGVWVLADRFSDATLAYQGYGRGLDVEHLRRLQDWATRGLWPHHTILLDCDVDVAFSRILGRNANRDRMEQEKRSFHQRVRDGYLELAKSEPLRFLVLNANQTLERVAADFRELFWKPLTGTG